VEFNSVDRDQRIHIPYILEPDAEVAAKGADDKEASRLTSTV